MDVPQDPLLSDARFAPSPVDAVVFDVGNVLIRWEPVLAVAAGVGRARAEAFLADPAFGFMEWNLAQDAGREWSQAEQESIAAYPHYAEEIRAYREHFPTSLTGSIEATVHLVSELHRAGVPLFALTNFSAELFPVALERFDFFDLFEDIVVSGQEGVAKPDPEIFEVLQERMNHVGALEDSIFIDDNEANVAAAESCGMDAILFSDTGHLRADLAARGLPVAPA